MEYSKLSTPQRALSALTIETRRGIDWVWAIGKSPDTHATISLYFHSLIHGINKLNTYSSIALLVRIVYFPDQFGPSECCLFANFKILHNWICVYWILWCCRATFEFRKHRCCRHNTMWNCFIKEIANFDQTEHHIVGLFCVCCLFVRLTVFVFVSRCASVTQQFISLCVIVAAGVGRCCCAAVPFSLSPLFLLN